jgi:hypothetical protein
LWLLESFGISVFYLVLLNTVRYKHLSSLLGAFRAGPPLHAGGPPPDVEEPISADDLAMMEAAPPGMEWDVSLQQYVAEQHPAAPPDGPPLFPDPLGPDAQLDADLDILGEFAV